MTPTRIFISSVQREFAREREQLCDFLRGGPLMRRFFEDVPASDRRPDEIYLVFRARNSCAVEIGFWHHRR